MESKKKFLLSVQNLKNLDKMLKNFISNLHNSTKKNILKE